MCGWILRARLMESVVLSAVRVVLRVGKCRVGVCLRAMDDARRFKKGSAAKHLFWLQRGELFFFSIWINELKTLGFGS
jgi:hypothetical protein